MSSLIKEIFWDDVKESAKFFIKNFRKIVKRTWNDFLKDFKNPTII
jgi:hypothetical protein